MSAGRDVLTDEQVAALVAAAKEGRLPDPADQASTPRRRRVRPIDFTRPSKFSSDQQRRLERAHETFCRTLSTRLSAELRTPISFELIDTAQLTYTGALEEAPTSALTAMIDVEPTGGQMLMCVELSAVLALLERLLGGGLDDEDATPVQVRHLTDVDLALTRRILQTLLDELSISLGELEEGLRLGLGEVGTERAPSGIVPLSEPTLALTLELKLARLSATLLIVMPHRAVEPILTASDPAVTDPHVDAAQAVGEALGSVEVSLRAEAGSTQMHIDDVLALQPGDVVALTDGAGGGVVTLFADQVALHTACLGRNGRRRAVQVTGSVEDDR